MKYPDFNEDNPEHLLARGSALRNVQHHPGWEHVLDIMEVLCQQAQYELNNSKSTNPNEIFALQKKVNGMWDLFEQTQRKINFFVEEAAQFDPQR